MDKKSFITLVPVSFKFLTFHVMKSGDIQPSLTYFMSNFTWFMN
jgi:hypothetical protein